MSVVRFVPSLRSARVGFAALVVAGGCAPAPAAHADPSDLSDQVKTVMEEAFNALPGDAFDLALALRVCGAVNPLPPPDCLDSLTVDLEALGFAFCSPGDPWAVPDPSPPAGTTVYGCANGAVASTVLLQGGARIAFQIDLTAFYVDAATRRPRSDVCPGDPPSGTVAGEGYLLAAASIAGEAQIVQVGGCTRLAPDAATIVVEVEPSVWERRGDACLAPIFDDPTFRPALLARLRDEAGTALHDLFFERMEAINETICALTPAGPGSWGRVKSRFDSGG